METHDSPAVGLATATRRDLATNALVLGAAAFVWFGWAQEGPPPGWSPFLAVGSGLGAVLAVVSPVLVLALAWLFCHQTHAAAPSVAAAIT